MHPFTDPCTHTCKYEIVYTMSHTIRFTCPVQRVAANVCRRSPHQTSRVYTLPTGHGLCCACRAGCSALPRRAKTGHARLAQRSPPRNAASRSCAARQAPPRQAQPQLKHPLVKSHSWAVKRHLGCQAQTEPSRGQEPLVGCPAPLASPRSERQSRKSRVIAEVYATEAQPKPSRAACASRSVSSILALKRRWKDCTRFSGAPASIIRRTRVVSPTDCSWLKDGTRDRRT